MLRACKHTPFPVVLYYDGKVRAHTHTSLSPDSKHDTKFVQHVNDHLIPITKQQLKDQGVDLKVVYFASDGCRGQFKLRAQWFWLSKTMKEHGVEGRHRFSKTMKEHGVEHVPQAGEEAEGKNILAELRRGREREMERAAYDG